VVSARRNLERKKQGRRLYALLRRQQIIDGKIAVPSPSKRDGKSPSSTKEQPTKEVRLYK
jgi:hypothetical protein